MHVSFFNNCIADEYEKDFVDMHVESLDEVELHKMGQEEEEEDVDFPYVHIQGNEKPHLKQEVVEQN